MRDFPGGPIAKTLSFQCRGPSLIPGQGTRQIPYATTKSSHAATKVLPVTTKTEDTARPN